MTLNSEKKKDLLLSGLKFACIIFFFLSVKTVVE